MLLGALLKLVGEFNLPAAGPVQAARLQQPPWILSPSSLTTGRNCIAQGNVSYRSRASHLVRNWILMVGAYRLSWVLTVLILGAAQTFADAQFGTLLPGTPPGPEVAHWVRLRVIGNTIQPARPIIWISPRAFSRRGPDQLTVLTPKEYNVFLGFAHSYRCSQNVPNSIKPETLLVTGYEAGVRRVMCVLPRDGACAFLSGMQTEPHIYWSNPKRKPIHNLAVSIGCERSIDEYK